ELHQFARQRREPIEPPLRRAVFDDDVLTLDVAVLVQSLPQSIDAQPPLGRFERAGEEEADPQHLARLLRARRERPRGSRPAERGKEGATPHHSITSSARESSVGGTARPSACAVLRLITNSNAVGSSTGRSAGRAPFRMPPPVRLSHAQPAAEQPASPWGIECARASLALLPQRPRPNESSKRGNRRYVNYLTLQGDIRRQASCASTTCGGGWHGNAPDSVFSGALRGAQFHTGSQTVRHLPALADIHPTGSGSSSRPTMQSRAQWSARSRIARGRRYWMRARKRCSI